MAEVVPLAASLLAQADVLEAQARTLRELARVLDGPTHRVDGRRWVRVRDAGLPARTIRAAIRSGTLAARRVGREDWIAGAELDAWVASLPVSSAIKTPQGVSAGGVDLPEPVRRALDAGRLRAVDGGRRLGGG